ncbi:MAG: radical SAM protein [Pseudomonadota bacterium]
MRATDGPARPRVLIINAYVHPWRSATPTRLFIPRAMAPYYLAGAFDRQRVDIRVHDEVHHGALLDPKLYAWPDMVVFTGLTAAFDRTRQLCAYVRHFSGAVTVIGGPIARALPAPCAAVFDHVLQGDVDEISTVIDEVFGPGHRADILTPAYDLGGRSRLLGAVETTVNCNFACAFCSLAGEKRPYVRHTDASITRQIEALGKVHALTILDNNFYGNDRKSFEARTELLGDHWRRGAFKGWGALVTMDFFAKPQNIELVAKNGCVALFSGVESLDPAVLKTFNKRHSLSSDPATLSKACAEHGIIFDYGMIFDFGQQTMAEVDGQMDTILGDPDIAIPGLISLTIPILGTPYFDTAAKAGRLMPNLRLCDCDGQKLVEWPKEPVEAVTPFVRDLLTFRGRKAALFKKAVSHAWRARRAFGVQKTLFNLVRPMVRYGGTVRLGTLAQMRAGWSEKPLTFCATTDPLSSAYRPHVPLPARYEGHFAPFTLTDANGAPTEAVQTRLLAKAPVG